MALRDAFCPNCGQPIQIEDTKEFCFCLCCGSKINVPKRNQPIIEAGIDVSVHGSRQKAQNMLEEELATNEKSPALTTGAKEKMKEAEFYYKLSIEKKEYENVNAEPTYYLKGQDLLVDLSQQYPSDYKIWWELCKPMDFSVVISGGKSVNPCTINVSYFDKALDLAPLDEKMEIVKQHDKYMESKASILKQEQEEKFAKEAEERARLEEEQLKQRAAEQEKKRQEEQRIKAKAEQEEREKKEAEIRAAEFAKAQQEMSNVLWVALKGKDYTSIDDSYFQFNSPEGVPIIATFKVMANVLYLSAFHVDISKNNIVYLDQSLAIHFADNGVAIKFDNKPVTVRGWKFNANILQMLVNPHGGYMINDLPLIKDSRYVANISKSAKKPFMSLKKIFN